MPRDACEVSWRYFPREFLFETNASIREMYHFSKSSQVVQIFIEFRDSLTHTSAQHTVRNSIYKFSQKMSQYPKLSLVVPIVFVDKIIVHNNSKPHIER